MHEIFRERARFPGVMGLLSGELAYPANVRQEFCALVVGPHPYMGGTMENPLVAAIAEEIAIGGGVSLRFDYGRTGESFGPKIDVAASMTQFWNTGHAPEDPERFQDVECAMSFCESLGVRPLTIVGYSFGAAAAWKMYSENRERFEAIVLVSPTIARHKFSMPAIPLPPPRMLVIHSRDDFCTPYQQLMDWTRSLPFSIDLRFRDTGNHFFRGSEHEIGTLVARFLAVEKEAVAC